MNELTVREIQVAVNTVYMGFGCRSGININKCTHVPSTGRLMFQKELASFLWNKVDLWKVGEILRKEHDGSNKNYIKIIEDGDSLSFGLYKWEPAND
jgi:hypothetical protein